MFRRSLCANVLRQNPTSRETETCTKWWSCRSRSWRVATLIDLLAKFVGQSKFLTFSVPHVRDDPVVGRFVTFHACWAWTSYLWSSEVPCLSSRSLFDPTALGQHDAMTAASLDGWLEQKYAVTH